MFRNVYTGAIFNYHKTVGVLLQNGVVAKNVSVRNVWRPPASVRNIATFALVQDVVRFPPSQRLLRAKWQSA